MPHDLHKDLEQGAQHGSQFTERINEYLKSNGKSLSDYERNRNSQLGAQVGAGLTGLEYLTGSKRPEVETFYDKHPAQAVTRNLADNAGTIGAGVGAAGLGHSLYRDIMHSHNFDKIEGTMLNGKTDDKGGKGMGSGSGFGEERGSGSEIGHNRFRKILSKMPMRTSPFNSGHGDNEEYARFVENNLPKTMGGKGVHTPDLGHIEESVTHHLGGNQDRAREITNIIKNRTGNNSVHGIAERHLGEGLSSMIPDAIGKSHVSPGLLRGISRVKGPAMLGGGIALGGMGLSALMKKIHEHTYGDDKIKDWTNSMRMTKGKFDELER